MTRFELAVGLTLLASAAACAHVLEAGADALAARDGGRGAPTAARGEPTGEPVAPTRPEPTVVSTYQHGATRDWRARTVSEPYSLTRSLFDRSGPNRVACQAVPLGLAQIHTVPHGSTSSPLFDLGPVHVGVAGNVVPLSTAFSLDRDVLADRALRSGSILAGDGPACSQALFFVVQLGGGRTQPHTVLY